MQQVRLSAQSRENTGKGAARTIRREGNVPAILYGQGEDPRPLKLDGHTFRRLLKSESFETALINLDLAGAEETVMVKDIQRDPISRDVLHIDFLRISLTEAVTTHIVIVTEGVPLGVREEGGILELTHRELNIRCLPTEIAQYIELSVESLAVNDSIHVADIQLPEGFECLDNRDTLLLSVRPPIVATTTETDELEDAEAGDEPEVITRRRDEEDADTA